ncbi:peptidoglycan-binding protein [Cryobacterium suzukii]|uniref:Peptidoglycan-binding protein n=1 Tax=Cryobacterium suzukii TaxID=1259198 RepID=A0A4R9ACZ1_9MICO|nr:peptidoglycan-binding domain-containing protein [Cryobacterium suzukii]TFD56752.1 peptidoglycan-binding protein [Cryobacterium suzukii]
MSDAAAVRSPRWARWVTGLLVAVGAGAGVGWAAATALTPPRDVVATTAFTLVEVVAGEVGSSINLNTVAQWTPEPAGSNQAVGTVTSVNVSAGQSVAAGATLYTVNLRPVVIAQGQIPAFRALAQDAAGADVTQLQQALTDLGLYTGAVDGKFGARTKTAVKAWQKALGVPADGVVQPGDVIFVPTLPTQVALDTEIIARGALLAGGENVVRALPPAPVFTVPVGESQAALMPTGTRVEITSIDGGLWEGFVTEQLADETGMIVITLAGKDGALICADACASIPMTEQSLLSSRIVTVESIAGLIVPSAALLSAADGTASVVDNSGVNHPVTVVTGARGMSIIDGVADGTSVRVPATAE